MVENIDDATNISGITNLLNNDRIDKTIASNFEKNINESTQISSSAEYNHTGFIEDVNNLFKQLKFDNQMDSSIKKPEFIKDDIPIDSLYTSTDTESSDLTNILSEPYTYNSHSSDLLPDITFQKTYKDPHLNEITKEHDHQRILKNVLTHDEDDEYIDKIEETDKKIDLLDKIDMLRDILDEERVKIDKIKLVNENDTLDNIKSTLKILDRKNNRTRNTTFAEDFILGGAYLLEDLFDGKKEYFNRKPDLTGWHKTVNTKLLRMRYDTTELAQGITEGLHLGSGARILIELIPSMFIYSRQRSQQHNSHAVSDEEVNSAINALDAHEQDTNKK